MVACKKKSPLRKSIITPQSTLNSKKTNGEILAFNAKFAKNKGGNLDCSISFSTFAEILFANSFYVIFLCVVK
jgi:hypothetical protein